MKQDKRLKIIHIITTLDNGGAETMLFKLLSHIDERKYDLTVISMLDEGFFGSKIQELGIPVYTLNMKRGVPSLSGLSKTLRLCKTADIIQTWMYHANLLGAVIKILLPKTNLIWGIRQSELKANKDKRSTIGISKICSLLSFLPSSIVSNSQRGIEFHSNEGYKKEKMCYIPNGIDLGQFNFDGQSLSELWGLKKDPSCKVLCTVGRWDIQKGYAYLLEALKSLSDKNINYKMIMCGTGLENSNDELVKIIRQYNLQDNVILLGRRNDINNILFNGDIFILSSIGEGFSNALGEAMACGLVCVATDVGDSKLIVGDAGIIVQAGDSQLLKEGILKAMRLSDEDRLEMGKRARERIQNNFTIEKIVEQFEVLYENII